MEEFLIFGLTRLGHTVEEEEANFGLILSFFLGSLCLSEKEGRKEDKGKLGSSLSRSRLGNYPNSLLGYLLFRKHSTFSPSLWYFRWFGVGI